MGKKSLIGVSLGLITCCLVIIGVAVWAIGEEKKNQDVVAEDTQTTETNLSYETEVEEVEPQKIRLLMTGDNLMHLSMVYSGSQPDGTLNYDMMFEPLKEHLAYADIKITNQETIFGGNHLGFSAFPRFNSPTELGDAIVKAGYNVVLHASNHAADKGIEGIFNCLEFWKQYPEVLVTGIYEEADVENQDIGLIEVDGVTFAILNYTYSPNLAALPKSIQGHLAMLCDWNPSNGMIDYKNLHPDVLTDIETAKQMADVVVVCPHWGTEYTFVPSSYQKKFAQQMTEAGADLIIGTHPHVIQPVEWVTAENGNKALCYYSLGNYVSTQDRAQTMLEAMAWVTFEVNEDGVKIIEEETGAIPMVCHYTRSRLRLEKVYFLEDYTEEKVKEHGIHYYDVGNYTLDNLHMWAEEVLGEWMLLSQDVFCERIESEYRK